MNKATTIILMLLAMCTSVSLAAPKIELVESKDKIDVKIDGKIATTYIYGDKRPKPSFVPVRTLSGIELTRRYPLTELAGGSDNEPHHVGVYFTADQVNGTDFWNNTKSSPQIKHIKTKQATGGDGKGTLSILTNWINEKGTVVIEENRTMTFIAGQNKGEYAIDISADLTAKVEKVVFEDIEEGVCAFRLSDYLREAKGDNYPQPGKPLPKESVKGTGMFFSSNGDQRAENIWGRRARWVAMQGVRDEKVVGVAMLNHPESLNFPTYWHVRAYGLLSGNPLGQGDFLRQSEYRQNPVLWLNMTLKKDQSIHFRFLIIMFEGIKTQDQIEQRYKEYVK
ncbi:MAG: DUF6807 domain-containing protein [Planctomycetota bacterium]|jgi:hypothetical protein